jgi:cobaltochelatase CobT
MSAALQQLPTLADLASKASKARADSRFRSLAIYAKLLGRRWNVNVVFDQRCETAATDGKVIKLRPCSIGDEDDAVLMEGLIDHEAGVHCRQTDFELAQKILPSEPAIVRALANVFEDVFGERELKKIKPGCAKTIERALEIMVQRGIFVPPKPDDHPASLLLGGLVDGLRSRKLGQRVLEDFFTQRWDLFTTAVGQPLADDIWHLANTVDDVHSTAEAIALAKKVFEKLTQSANEPPPPPAQGPSHGDEEDTDASFTDGFEPQPEPSSGSHSDSDFTQSRPQVNGQETEQASDNSQGSSGDESVQGAVDQPEATDHGGCSPPKTAHQQQAVQATLDASDEDTGSGDFGDALASALVSSDAELQAAASGLAAGSTWELEFGTPVESNSIDLVISELARPVAVRLGSKLDQLLEAETSAATELKRSGRRLHTQRLVRLRTASDTRVFRSTDEITAVDTCVMVLTDVSASMAALLHGGSVSRISGASAVTRALGDTLNRFDVPFAVRYFGSRLTRVKEFDNNWRTSRSLYWGGLEDSTCTDQALLSVIPEISSRMEQRKLLVLVTDGVPSNVGATVLALHEARRHGVQVTTLLVTSDQTLTGLATALISAGLPASTVKSPDELAQRVFEAVESAF